MLGILTGRSSYLQVSLLSYLLRPIFEIVRSVEDNFTGAVVIDPTSEVSYRVDGLFDLAENFCSTFGMGLSSITQCFDEVQFHIEKMYEILLHLKMQIRPRDVAAHRGLDRNGINRPGASSYRSASPAPHLRTM